MAVHAVSDRTTQGSIITASAMARENVRTTRDIVPSEGFEHVNELLPVVRRKKLAGKTLRKDRYEFLSQIVHALPGITGLLAGTMSHDPPTSSCGWAATWSVPI